MKSSLGLYLHIPFCVQKCRYCDFCSFPAYSEDTMRMYVHELCRRLSDTAPLCSSHVVDTVYFGGGTPTLLPLDCFDELFSALRTHYELAPSVEITCECNPATADLTYFRQLRALGVNRLSIGMQSAHENELALLGRIHSFRDLSETVSLARSAGFDNISLDLMYGIPDQTADSFRRTLEAAVALAPEHISAYGLKIEEGTPFWKRKDSLSLPDEDTEFEMYGLCTDILGRNGYAKYEISNFAKVGRESRHNLRYWQRKDYLGFGVAAHSCFGGERFAASRDLSAFLEGKDIPEERIPLTELDEKNEYLILGLRLAAGIDLNDFKARFGMPLEEYAPSVSLLCDHGFLCRKDGRIFFTDRGFFVSNAILAELMKFP